jgi:hypothetical protein
MTSISPKRWQTYTTAAHAMAEQAYIHHDGITRVVNCHVEAFDRYIGRPSKWGCPFKLLAPHPKTGAPMTRTMVIDLYIDWLYGQPQLLKQIKTLKGCTLGCFCKPLACHGDVLAELAND